MNPLADVLTQKGVLKTQAIIEAFSRVDRKDFVPRDFQGYAYGDYPLPIAGEQTISQPTTVAFMLELLQPRQGEKILDVGSGSGWTTALLAFLVGEKGRVFGVERVPELVAFGAKNLGKYDFPQAIIVQAEKTLGFPKEAPFDKILVSAAAEGFPESLLSQLKEGGILVIPVRDAVWRVKKLPGTPPNGEASKTEIQKFGGFAFVPLVER
ncbi:MAG: protein-L-isoaspartate O-methyltransferase [Parcubacteria group bacterium]|nr:protein-L-isoaspartate O-methyltransferase [Parcubacteria group bacterium]